MSDKPLDTFDTFDAPTAPSQRKVDDFEEFNPYQAPQSEFAIVTPGVPIFRDRKLLVFAKDYPLPDRCVLCNAPAEGKRIKKTLMWHNPAWYLLILFNLILYVLVAMIISKRAKVAAGICPRHRKRRTRAFLIGWLVLLVSTVLLPLATTISDPTLSTVGVGVALVLMIGSVIFLLFRTNFLSPKRITKTHVIIGNAGAAFLNSLPVGNAPTD